MVHTHTLARVRLALPDLLLGTPNAPLRTRGTHAAVVALLGLLLALAGGMFRLDPDIEGQWPGYHYGDLQNRLNNINLAARLRAAGVVLDYRDRQTPRAIENHEENFYFDDVGYIMFAQVGVLSFGEVSERDLLHVQNTVFVMGLVGTAAAFSLLVGGVVPGVVAFGFLSGLHFAFRGFVYNTASQPGFVIPMAAIAVALILILPTMVSGQRISRWGWTGLFVSGAAFGAILLIRYPIGSSALIAGLISIVIAGNTWKRRGYATAALIAGFFAMQNLVPGVVAMHRDTQLGWERKGILEYLSAPPKHKPWFTMLALVGRYENSLGLVIRDSAVDQLLVSRKQAEPQRWPEDYSENFDTIARDVLFDYVRAHPGEYFWHRFRGAMELFAVVPAITFQSGDNFTGGPNFAASRAHLIDPRDLRPESNQMINVRFAYLNLSPIQWLLYFVALAGLAASVVYVLFNWRRRAETSHALAGVGALWALYAAGRGLIPWYGQDFVFVSWVLPILGVCCIATDMARAQLVAKEASSGDL